MSLTARWRRRPHPEVEPRRRQESSGEPAGLAGSRRRATRRCCTTAAWTPCGHALRRWMGRRRPAWLESRRRCTRSSWRPTSRRCTSHWPNGRTGPRRGDGARVPQRTAPCGRWGSAARQTRVCRRGRHGSWSRSRPRCCSRPRRVSALGGAVMRPAAGQPGGAERTRRLARGSGPRPLFRHHAAPRDPRGACRAHRRPGVVAPERTDAAPPGVQPPGGGVDDELGRPQGSISGTRTPPPIFTRKGFALRRRSRAKGRLPVSKVAVRPPRWLRPPERESHRL